jgi:hypothetical protein
MLLHQLFEVDTREYDNRKLPLLQPDDGERADFLDVGFGVGGTLGQWIMPKNNNICLKKIQVFI